MRSFLVRLLRCSQSLFATFTGGLPLAQTNSFSFRRWIVASSPYSFFFDDASLELILLILDSVEKENMSAFRLL